jgi:V-type H+-transporting ATPase subunit d
VKHLKVNYSISKSKLTVIFLDLRLQLGATDYGSLLQNEPSPIATSTIAEKLTQSLVEEFNYIRTNAVQPLTKFLDYIT